MLIAAVCGDAGGAEAVAPVLAALEESESATMHALAYGQARDVWGRRRVIFEAIDEAISARSAADVLRRWSTSLLLTGTSMNSAMLEARFVEAARDLAIPSVAVLDAWVNYKARFATDDNGRPLLPDRIAIMDERARSEMIAAGFDPSRLVVTGQPAFDDLPLRRASFTESDRNRMREKLGVGKDRLLVLFASQPLSAIYGNGDLRTPLFGFDEIGVLRSLVGALERIASRVSRSITLLVRPHPRENFRLLATVTSDQIEIILSSEGEGRDAALAADLVTGMNSALLLEACYMRCVTVSVQPGLLHNDILPTNDSGLSHPVYDAAQLEPTIERFLLDEHARFAAREELRGLSPSGDAARRVVELVHDMLRESEGRS
ncbi:MAG: hypothetical protein PVSMB1_03650 [Gemmatimonadaceae bacterium]